jgi:hypothetical protein
MELEIKIYRSSFSSFYAQFTVINPLSGILLIDEANLGICIMFLVNIM